MSRSLSCIRAMTALAAVATILGGCAAANNATSSQAADQAEQPYKTAYGISKRRTDDRPLQRTVRAQATRRPNGSRAHDGRDPAGSTGANGGRNPARSTRCCACLVKPARDRNRVDPPGQTRDRVDATSSAGAGPRRSRATSGPAAASSRAGRSHGLWHHGQRADDRSVHRVVWAQASRRPVSVKSCAEPAAKIRQR